MIVNHRIAAVVAGGVIHGIAFSHDEHPHTHEEYSIDRAADYLRSHFQTAPISGISGLSGFVVSF